MHLDTQHLRFYDTQAKDRDERLSALEQGLPKLWNIVCNAVNNKACTLIT